ncbi:hypothetical protein ACSIGC_08145 [Tenacibaculum sp. ZS6-P6]|uniref:hypothetical protein n=1 Tax=Tenacibaculum sp. ZS6-P6 TaxID=3447503 RepID=UPI003F9A72CA
MKLRIAFLLLFFSIAVYAQKDSKTKNIGVEDLPLIAKGTAGQAVDISALFPVIVLHISGGKDPKYSATDYAKMFHLMFKDKKYTQYPTEIYVRYEESGKDRKTSVRALISRRNFDKNGGEYENGDGVFTPAELVNYIPVITERFAKLNSKDFKTNKTEGISFIRKGKSSDAHLLSAKINAIVIHVSGGQDKKYSAEDYAKMFRIMFKDKKRTQYPTDIYVYYEESSSNRRTLISAYLQGKYYDKSGGEYEGGDGVFSPKQLLDHIPILTKRFANGTAMRKE